MSTALRDLWPDAFDVRDLLTPVTILKQQAALLGPKTNNLVEAEVTSSADGPRFIHKLVLVAPALDSYRYQLITISHTIELYPVNVVYHARNSGSVARDQEELVEQLGSKLSDEKTTSLIRALIAQSRQ